MVPSLPSTALALNELLKERRTLRVTCRLAVAPTASGDVAEFVSIDAAGKEYLTRIPSAVARFPKSH
jgi:hypothetical protein